MDWLLILVSVVVGIETNDTRTQTPEQNKMIMMRCKDKWNDKERRGDTIDDNENDATIFF